MRGLRYHLANVYPESSTVFIFFILLIVIVAIVVGVSSADEKQRQLQAALQAYQGSLAALKKRPTDADLKQRTLALGRAYSSLTRESKGVTVFDEVALSNDIGAACAGATASVPAAAPRQNPEARLEQLAALRTRGLVDEDEYQAERRRILSEI